MVRRSCPRTSPTICTPNACSVTGRGPSSGTTQIQRSGSIHKASPERNGRREIWGISWGIENGSGSLCWLPTYVACGCMWHVVPWYVAPTSPRTTGLHHRSPSLRAGSIASYGQFNIAMEKWLISVQLSEGRMLASCFWNHFYSLMFESALFPEAIDFSACEVCYAWHATQATGHQRIRPPAAPFKLPPTHSGYDTGTASTISPDK